MDERKTGIKILSGFIFVTCSLGLLMALSCFLVYGSISVFDKSLPLPLFPTPTIDPTCKDYECLQVCLRQLPNMINQTDSLDLTGENSQHPNRIDIISYKVSPDRLSLTLLDVPKVPDNLKKYQDDRDLHQRIWRYYAKIFPETQESQITYVVFYTDGPMESSASIQEVDHLWHLYIDIQDFNNQYDTTAVLIHEYGHILTVGDSQVTSPKWHYFVGWTRKDFDEIGKTCPDFFTGSDCASPGSYLAEFGHRFWAADIYNPWVETVFLPRAQDKEKNKDAVQKFYEQYHDRFVSEYAATNPVEDIAETWLDFVLQPKPTGNTIADQKVLFFYEYDKLVQTRGKIIQGICNYAAGAK